MWKPAAPLVPAHASSSSCGNPVVHSHQCVGAVWPLPGCSSEAHSPQYMPMTCAALSCSTSTSTYSALVQPYSRIQSGVGQVITASPRRHWSPAVQSPQQAPGTAPATSFASVVSRHAADPPATNERPDRLPAVCGSAHHLRHSFPWADGAVLEVPFPHRYPPSLRPPTVAAVPR